MSSYEGTDQTDGDWFCDFGSASGLEPLSVPVFEGSGVWYVEGQGFVDNHWRQDIGLPARSLSSNVHRLFETVNEITQWRAVAGYLAIEGHGIMDESCPSVPHAD